MMEIIAAIIDGGRLTTNREAIADALEDRRVTQWIDRKTAVFMASLDLGPQWVALVEPIHGEKDA